MRRYSFEQAECLFYMSRKNHFRLFEKEIDVQSKAIATRISEKLHQEFGL